MGKAYLIMVGEYSDRHCVGWCSTEAEAQRICAARNSAVRNGDYYDVEECACLDGSVEGDVCAGWAWRFEFKRADDGWKKVYASYLPWLACRHEPKIEVLKTSIGVLPQIMHVRVTIWQKDDDWRRALKAAWDALYEFIAKQEGAVL